MFAAYLAVTVVMIVVTAVEAVATMLRVEFVVANATEVGVPQPWLSWLGAVKLAGVAGLLLGLLG